MSALPPLMMFPIPEGLEFTAEEAERRREEIGRWFRSAGLLWAVNRFVLHPAGVALAIQARAEPGDPRYGEPMTAEEERSIGYMFAWPTVDPEGWSFLGDDDEQYMDRLAEAFPDLAAALRPLLERSGTP